MADNVTTNPGSGGAVVASDDIGGVQYQRIKVVIGSDGVNGGDVSSSNPMPTQVAAGTLVNRSGTITTGGTAQQAMAANAARMGFAVQNVSSGDLWVNVTGAATAGQPSLLLVPGAYYETPPGYGATGAVSILGATTGQQFSAREW